jgi:hypothetical protein
VILSGKDNRSECAFIYQSINHFSKGGKMKALSIKQPLAGLVVAGIKNVENRSWAPKQAIGMLAIVSTATPDAAKWWQPLREKCQVQGVTFPEELCKINGATLGTVEFNYVAWTDEQGNYSTDHPTIDESVIGTWWDPDSIGFIFEHPKRLVTPIPLKGQLGLYNLAPEVEAEIKKQLSSKS